MAALAFTSWAMNQCLVALPAIPETVAAYGDALAAKERKPASIRQAVWAIATLHRAGGLPDPSKAELVRLALKRMGRSLGSRQRQAAPLGDAKVAQIVATVRANLTAIRDVALLLTMRDLLARHNEVAAFDLDDLERASDGAGTALIRGARAIRPVPARCGGCLDDLRAASALAEDSWDRQWSGLPAGEQSRRGGHHGVAGRRGIADPEAARHPRQVGSGDYLRHSARVGMAQDLVAGGADLAAVMQAGRWKSPTMPAHYAERLLARRGAVASHHGRRG